MYVENGTYYFTIRIPFALSDRHSAAGERYYRNVSFIPEEAPDREYDHLSRITCGNQILKISPVFYKRN